jgi:putative tryptophan/tyrosine transport system substrate-binding protein
VSRIGYLSLGSSTGIFEEAFLEELRELGRIEGQNLVIEYRRAEGKPERLPGFAGELVRGKVDVIVAPVTDTAVAAKRATSTIPIVMGPGGRRRKGAHAGSALGLA